MPKLYIVGLGTGDFEDLTFKAHSLINSDLKKFARTIRHPIFKNNIKNLFSFDYLYEKHDEIEEVYNELKQIILDELKQNNELIYLVPGSPYNSDLIVEDLIKNSSSIIDIEIIDGMSFLDKALKLLNNSKMNIKLIDANDVSKLNFDIHSTNIIGQIESRSLASKLKIEMQEVYPDDYKIKIIDVLDNKIEDISLFNIDRQKKYDYSTYISVESIENSMLPLYNINDLINLMIILRSSDGCPWDRKQTHSTLRECVIEEAYEVVEAIENNDIDNLVEELGDLLLQVVFHAQIASEEGYFDFADIVKGIYTKLYIRHPHVFGDKDAENENDAKLTWEEVKKLEKNFTTYTQKLNDIPKSMSPLSRGYKIQKVAAEVGFDWPDISGAILKVKEETTELMEAYNLMDKSKVEEELGDLIFALINFSRYMNINPDIALNRTNLKFIKRFKFIEENAEKNLKDMTLEEMDYLWELSKRH